jgi:hypothetical protein
MSDLSYGSFAYYGGYGASQKRFVLISQSINNVDVQDSFKVWSPEDPSRFRGNARQLETLRSDRPLAGWSDQWLGYTRYDSVMVTADDLSGAPGEIVTALARYIEVGGCLIVIGTWTPPPSWRATLALTPSGLAQAPMGFGSLIVNDRTAPRQWQADRWHAMYEAMTQTAAPFQAQRDVSEANKIFKVIEELGVPVKGLFLLMLIFAVVIGPVNLYMLSKHDRRLWMIWTVPIISLLFCGVVFAYNLVAEGWQSHGRTQGITILDQPARRATTIGWTAFYAPLTPGDGLHFSLDTEVTPQVRLAYGTGGEGRAVNQDVDQHMVSGWVQARVPAIFVVRKSELERRRVDILVRDGAYAATNGLGADIEDLIYRDGQGRYYRGQKIAAGQTVTLTPYTPTSTGRPTPEAWRQIYSGGTWPTIAESRDPATLLAGNDYTALLTRTPFIENGLSSARYRDSRSLIYGILGTEGEP